MTCCQIPIRSQGEWSSICITGHAPYRPPVSLYCFSQTWKRWMSMSINSPHSYPAERTLCTAPLEGIYRTACYEGIHSGQRDDLRHQLSHGFSGWLILKVSFAAWCTCIRELSLQWQQPGRISKNLHKAGEVCFLTLPWKKKKNRQARRSVCVRRKCPWHMLYLRVHCVSAIAVLYKILSCVWFDF